MIPEPVRFGRFLLLERLAVGGMAELFRAELTGPYGFAKTVAIKKILPAFSRRQRFRKMFLRESRIMAELHHGNLVQVYELGEVDGDLFMCLEYVDGCDLSKLIRHGQTRGQLLPAWLSVWLVREVARGLDYLHGLKNEQGVARSIVHRDVNPHNILLSVQGEVKLGDFGIAKGLTDELQTRQGQIKGKLEYLSPEQAKGDVLGPASDLYALGLVLFELLTGQRYLQGSNDFDLMRAAARPVWRSAREVNGQVDQATDDLLARMLRPEAQARFGSAAALVAALDGLGLTAPGADPAGRLATELRRVRAGIDAAAPPRADETEAAADDDPLRMVPSPTDGAREGTRRTGTLSLDDLARARPRRIGLGLALGLAVLVAAGWLWWGRGDGEAELPAPAPPAAPVTAAASAPAPKADPLPEPDPADDPAAAADPMIEVDQLLAIDLAPDEDPEERPGRAQAARRTPPRSKNRRRRSKPKEAVPAKATVAIQAWSAAQIRAWQERWRALRADAAQRGIRPGDCRPCDDQARLWAQSFRAQDDQGAQAAAQAYAAAVRAQPVDGAFIDRKLKRLQAALDRAGASHARETQVKQIRNEVVDGRFEQANRAINKLLDGL